MPAMKIALAGRSTFASSTKIFTGSRFLFARSSQTIEDLLLTKLDLPHAECLRRRAAVTQISTLKCGLNLIRAGNYQLVALRKLADNFRRKIPPSISTLLALQTANARPILFPSLHESRNLRFCVFSYY